MSCERLVGIDDAVTLIRDTTGIPVTKSRIHKDSMRGIAPRRYLWRPDDMVAYARGLVKPVGAA